MNHPHRRIGAFVLSLAALAVLSACGSKEERIAAHLHKGDAYLQQSDWDKASVEVRNVLQMDPKQAAGFLLAGRIEEGREEYRRAYANYAKAIELKPDLIEAKGGLARIYLLAGDAVHAAATIDEILAVDPANAEAHVLRAGLYARRGDSDAAMRELTPVLRSGKAVPSNASLLGAGLYVTRGDDASAIQTLDQALVNDPNNISLLGAAADVSARMKADARVEDYYRRATVVAPKNFSLWLAWARFQVQRDRTDAAEKVLRDAIAAAPDDSDRYLALTDLLATRRGRAAAEKEYLAIIAARPRDDKVRFGLVNFYRADRSNPKNADAARQLLKDIIANDKAGPSGVEARNQLAAEALDTGHVREAGVLLDEILKINPRDGAALLKRGRIEIAAGDTRAAIVDLRAAAKDQPNSSQVIGLLVDAYLANGETQLARDAIAEAVKTSPVNADLRLLYAGFLTRMKGRDDRQGALFQADEALRLAPRDLRAWDLKASLQRAAGDRAGAEKTLAALKAQLPNDPAGYIRMGQLYADQKKYDAARQEFDGAAQRAPGRLEPLVLTVTVLMAQRKFDEAAQRIAAVQARDPRNPTLYRMQGELALARNDGAGAEAALRHALELAPGQPDATLMLARVLATRQRMPEALALLDGASKAHPDDNHLRATLADWQTRSGDYDRAIANYELNLTRNPGDSSAANNLAFILAEYKTDRASLDRALQVAARFGDSGDPGLIDTLGWVHFRRGEYERAATLLGTAADKAPDAALLQYHLGMALYRKGDATQARVHLNKAMQGKGANALDGAAQGEARKVLGEG